MRQKANWYFDVISPFAYLQSRRVESLSERLEITPVPVLFAGLLNHWGQLGPAEIEPKRQFIFRQVMWRAQRSGIPFRMPPGHPFNPLWGLRLIAEHANSWEAIHIVFDHIWAQGRGVESESDRSRLAETLGMTLAEADKAVQKIQNKQAIKDNTDAAIAAGIYGVPSLQVSGQTFWGEDSVPMLEDWLDNTLDFESEAMKSIDKTPVSSPRLKH